MPHFYKKWILGASYYDLLKRHRFAKDGDLIFHGESGKFYIKIMGQKCNALENSERVKISKLIGW